MVEQELHLVGRTIWVWINQSVMTSAREGGAAVVVSPSSSVVFGFVESQHVRILSVRCAVVSMSCVLPSVTSPKNPKYAIVCNNLMMFPVYTGLIHTHTHFYFHAFNRPNPFNKIWEPTEMPSSHFQMSSLCQWNVCCGPHNEAYPDHCCDWTVRCRIFLFKIKSEYNWTMWLPFVSCDEKLCGFTAVMGEIWHHLVVRLHQTSFPSCLF